VGLWGVGCLGALVILAAALFVAFGVFNPGPSPQLSASQRQFIHYVRIAGMSPRLISDQDALNEGHSTCGALEKGVTYRELVRGYYASFGHTMKAVDKGVIGMFATEALCPSYESEAAPLP
jgi:hypothetical protein